MYFWKIEKLKKELVEAGLSQGGLFKYIFVYVLLSAVIMEIFTYLPANEFTGINVILSLSNILIASFGTYLCYFFNGGKNGTHFAERYFSIGFVVAVRFVVLLFFIMVLLGVILSSGEDPDNVSTDWYSIAVITIWSLLLYWRTVFHINQVAKQCNA